MRLSENENNKYVEMSLNAKRALNCKNYDEAFLIMQKALHNSVCNILKSFPDNVLTGSFDREDIESDINLAICDNMAKYEPLVLYVMTDNEKTLKPEDAFKQDYITSSELRLLNEVKNTLNNQLGSECEIKNINEYVDEYVNNYMNKKVICEVSSIPAFMQVYLNHIRSKYAAEIKGISPNDNSRIARRDKGCKYGKKALDSIGLAERIKNSGYNISINVYNEVDDNDDIRLLPLQLQSMSAEDAYFAEQESKRESDIEDLFDELHLKITTKNKMKIAILRKNLELLINTPIEEPFHFETDSKKK